MIKTFTDYYRGELLTNAECRYDITKSTGSYQPFEHLLINKRKFNVGGLSFNYVERPDRWKGEDGRRAQKALTKGNVNVSSVFIPNLKKHLIGYGDVNGTHDALIILFNASYSVIEVFIARSYANDIQALYTYVTEGEYNHEFEALRKISKEVLKGRLPKR